jgi:hypothetical protein
VGVYERIENNKNGVHAGFERFKGGGDGRTAGLDLTSRRASLRTRDNMTTI